MIKLKITGVLLGFMLSGIAGCALISSTDPYEISDMEKVGATYRPAFHQAVVIPDKPILLDAAIEIALQNNPDLAQSKYASDAAAARHSQAIGRALPRISAVGGYTKYIDDQRLIPPRYNGESGVFGDNIYSADIVLSQPIFTGGRLINEIDASKLIQQSAIHQSFRTRNELIFNVSGIFYSILAQKEVIKSLAFSKDAMNEHLNRINALIARKKAAKVDRLRTEVRIADIDQSLTHAKNVLSIEKRRLANLMGAPDIMESFDVCGTLERESFAGVDLEDSLETAFQFREDYLAARAELEAHAKFVDVARAGHWPSISLQGAYGMRWTPDSPPDPSDDFPGTDSAEDLGRVGIFVELPIFEGGQVAARVREQRAALSASREKLRSLVFRLRLDVETAGLNIESASKRIDTTQKSIEQAQEALRIERKKYDHGKGALIDVLDAQNALLASQTNYYQAKAEYNTAVAQLRLATGEMK
jgi:outer membrane protein TolC